MEDKFTKIRLSTIALMLFIGIAGFSLGFYIPNEKPVVTKAQGGECEIADATINTPVLCWAADAADFVIDNNLFSLFTSKDLRDAVKHYRFYQLVTSELGQ